MKRKRLMKRKQTFVVMGSTGEYSDRSEWPVRAYATERGAQAFMAYCETWDREHGAAYDKLTFAERDRTKPEHDPNYHRDYTGTSYYIMPVDLY